MRAHRRYLASLSLVLFLSLPAQAGALYVCSMSGAAQSECCCKTPGPGEPAVVREAGSCCCTDWHWPALEPSLQLAADPILAPAIVTELLSDFAELRHAPAPWMVAERLPADPDPPELYLTSRSFLS